MVSLRTRLRLLSALGLLAGLTHLLLAGRLLATARWGYDRLLAVDFDPRPNATRRVRLVGVLFLGVAALLRSLARRVGGA
ncbi:hypothetical protein EI982_14495 [Haloplanus rallus]|jgi:hypothetical protein|uniref:Uncharacterized protein n=1 Tax=Haloplanus rallus TaxID=1816183 RepID=A0A6B9FAW4_9EURY|nr:MULTISPECIES: hypothetical protein [Haloplanus]QGX95907.1 hypothetical protein EI982_14495 [Haloplanus rallus]